MQHELSAAKLCASRDSRGVLRRRDCSVFELGDYSATPLPRSSQPVIETDAARKCCSIAGLVHAAREPSACHNSVSTCHRKQAAAPPSPSILWWRFAGRRHDRQQIAVAMLNSMSVAATILPAPVSEPARHIGATALQPWAVMADGPDIATLPIVDSPCTYGRQAATAEAAACTRAHPCALQALRKPDLPTIRQPRLTMASVMLQRRQHTRRARS